MTALNIAAAHVALALLLQIGNYGFYLAGNGTTAALSWAQLFLLPAAQVSTLVVAGLLGTVAAMGQGRAGGRVAVFIAAFLCNSWLVLDQRVYAVFFAHFTPELVDAPAWGWFAERVFARIDSMLFIAMAALIVVTVWIHRCLWRGPLTVCAKALHERDAEVKKGTLRPGVAGALAAAIVAAMVIISANTELRDLNSHPLATLFYKHVVTPKALSRLRPQVNIYAPRYGSIADEPDPLSQSNIRNRLTDFGDARPNLVLVHIKSAPRTRVGGGALGKPLLDSAVKFDHIVPGRNPPETLVDAMMSRLTDEGYAPATFVTPMRNRGAGEEFSANPCVLLNKPSPLHAWMKLRREAGVPVVVHAVLDEDSLTGCTSNGSAPDVDAFTSGIAETFKANGWDHQTVFAFLVEIPATSRSVGSPEADGIATMGFALATPGHIEAVQTSARAGTAEDVIATLHYLLGLKPAAGRDLLAPQLLAQNLFWVEDGVMPYWGVRDGDWIYHASALGTDQQLYNLAVDPAQASNLALLLPRQAALYRSLCATWFAVEGHERIANKSAFVSTAQGWWLPMDLGMPGAKRVDFGVTGDRPVLRQTVMRRFNPYDPVIAQVSLRPFGERRQINFEWFGPRGRIDTFTFQVESMWNSVWIVPNSDFPMTPGRWTMLVSEQGVPLVGGEFVVDPDTPQSQPWANEPRVLLEIVSGVYGPLEHDTGAPEFHPREHFASGETPVVQTRWAAGAGVHKLTFTWRSPGGEVYIREHGLREEWEALRAELTEPVQPWTPGDWEVTVHEGGALLGRIVVHIHEIPR